MRIAKFEIIYTHNKSTIMTDLSMLFTSSLVDKSIEPFNIESKASRKELDSSFMSTSRKTQHWDLTQLEASIKKGIKKQVCLSALSQEIECFSVKQKQQYRKKAWIFGGIIILISYLAHLDRRIIFHFALLLFLKLTPSLPFSFIQETIIRTSSKIMTPLVYSALFYYLLKWATNTDMTELSLALTFTCIVFSTIFAVIQYLQPVFNLTTEHIFFNTINENEYEKGIIIFLSYVYQRFRFYYNTKILLVGALIISFVLQFAIFLYIKGEIMVFLGFKNFLIAFVLFLALELFFLLFRYIDFFFEQIKTLKNKMHIFMSLLRIEGKTSYRKIIQDKCLRNILYKTIQNPCFLGTQTCKSLIYETYMDIFNQIATIQLERTHSDIKDNLSIIKTNSMVINSNKTLIRDLFIKFRKTNAYILQQLTTVNSLESLSKVILLMRIIILADQQAHTEKQPVKPNSRLVNMIEMIQQKLYILASEQTILPFLRSQLMFNERKLSGWISSMRKGWI